MRLKLSFAVILVVVLVLIAGVFVSPGGSHVMQSAEATVNPPLPSGGWMLVANGPPKTAFLFSAWNGPPKQCGIGGNVLTYDPEDGLYHQAPPGSDTFTYSGGVGTFVDWPPYPQLGPPQTYTGPCTQP